MVLGVNSRAPQDVDVWLSWLRPAGQLKDTPAGLELREWPMESSAGARLPDQLFWSR
jgi:hypothetical protein